MCLINAAISSFFHVNLVFFAGKVRPVLKLNKNSLPYIKICGNWYHLNCQRKYFYLSTTFILYGHLVAQKYDHKWSSIFHYSSQRNSLTTPWS